MSPLQFFCPKELNSIAKVNLSNAVKSAQSRYQFRPGTEPEGDLNLLEVGRVLGLPNALMTRRAT